VPTPVLVLTAGNEKELQGDLQWHNICTKVYENCGVNDDNDASSSMTTGNLLSFSGKTLYSEVSDSFSLNEVSLKSQMSDRGVSLDL
jgi:hypothetical protein